MFAKWLKMFDLSEDQADFQQIRSEMIQASQVHGSNLWILACAIIIACVGLNLNATAVVIGAMLISPLMAPLQTMGLGLALFDLVMFKEALKTLAVFVAVSLMVSVFYFLLTPLGDAQSELLSRTTPMIWDVAVAIFGGLAGVIGSTRQTKSSVIPGVAIATALMPPLCTVGFGIAHKSPEMAFGALYLFAINVFFITASNALFWRKLVTLPQMVTRQQVRPLMQWMLYALMIVMTMPSIFIAYQTVERIGSEKKLARFFDGLELTQDLVILKRQIDWKKKVIRIYGESPRSPAIGDSELQKYLENGGLQGFRVISQFREPQPGNIEKEDKSETLESFYSLYEEKFSTNEQKTRKLETELSHYAKQSELHAQILNEMKILFPEASKSFVGQGILYGQETDASEPLNHASSDSKLTIILETEKELPLATREKILAWIEARTDKPQINFMIAQSNRKNGRAKQKGH